MSDIRNDEVGLFLARELETILSRSFEVEYADIKYSQVLPISTEVASGSDSYTYRIFDAQGSNEDDCRQGQVIFLALTSCGRKSPCLFAALGRVLHIQSKRRGLLLRCPGMNLEQRRANAVRRAYEEKVQDVAFFGDAPSGMKGLVNSDQVDKIVPNKWFDGASTTTDEMLEILNEAPTRIVNGSNQKETPNTMLVPYDVYRIISTTARSTTSDTTVMEFFLRTNPFIRSIEPINELAASKSVLAKDRIICYDRSPEKLQLHIPQTLEFLPPVRTGLEFTVASHARIGGTAVYYPKSVLYVEKA